ncbi:DUF6456 domain-containing protein [Alsobacter sp. SYSU BS001988]
MPSKPSAVSGARASGPLRLLAKLAALPDGSPASALASLAAHADALVRSDLACWTGRGDDRRLRLSTAGAAFLRRRQAAPEHAFLAQHRPLSARAVEIDGREAPVVMDDAESPLAWLRRRTGKDGRPLLDDARYAAGERFRADLTLGMVLPRVTASWSAGPTGGRRGAGVEHVTDLALAARQRCDHAARSLGAEMAALLIDVCGFLKGLEEVERERGWPARSAKVVLAVALGRLAEHYGLAVEAVGPARSTGVRMWGAADYRPTLAE